ncbi:MAG TPA: nucleoside phosphorylase [Saprospiraceae bacterium]|nr:nucleoside phosphorylase [Saprospiraceae bacterium]
MREQKVIADSELILRPDGSIYHLGITPGFLSDKIITVGDPERAEWVARYFDKVENIQRNREFTCLTGIFQGEAISVISTGIGTDNIDIVFNEVDALFNIDFERRQLKAHPRSLRFFRLGTSGIVSERLNVGDIAVSTASVGFDSLGQFYQIPDFWHGHINGIPYYQAEADAKLMGSFDSFLQVKTATMPGFYGPQNRFLRIKKNKQIAFWQMIDKLELDNLEMETSGIYLMSKLLGHQAISINALLAHRRKGIFHPQPEKIIQNMIEKSLPIIAAL